MQGLNHSNALAVLLRKIGQGGFLFLLLLRANTRSLGAARDDKNGGSGWQRRDRPRVPFGGVHLHELSFFENFRGVERAD